MSKIIKKKGRPKKYLTEEDLKEKKKKHRQKYKKYIKKYNKYYYLKKILEDPNYNKKKYLRERERERERELRDLRENQSFRWKDGRIKVGFGRLKLIVKVISFLDSNSCFGLTEIVLNLRIVICRGWLSSIRAWRNQIEEICVIWGKHYPCNWDYSSLILKFMVFELFGV